MIGEIVGEYRIVSQLAAGGVGDVFLGEHAERGAKASIEIMHPQVAAQPAAQQYLETVKAVSNIKHTGTIKLVGAVLESAGRSYVISELLDGETLAKRIEASGRLSVTQIGEIGRQLANVLAATHDEAIIHGDVRPDAIFLMKQGGLARGEPIKVTEFGVATLKRALGIAIGPVYTAPELLGSGATVDWRVDAYALGCVVFEMATGRPPFLGATAEEVRTKHLEQQAPAARSLMPDVPPALDQLIGRLLSKRPEDRYASMREIARALEPFGGAAQPLAQTADIPVLVIGEVQAHGEIQVRTLSSGPKQAVVDDLPMLPPAEATAQMKKQGSRMPLMIVVIVVLLAVAGTAIALGMR